MTVITKLKCRGFKSFAKNVEVNFLPGFNCVMGPNGFGKSNVIDAICFVLGKSSAKGLRAEKSANLIYNGGKKGKGASEAEVSIYFDNSKKIFPYDEKEVKFTRIVKKTGNSKYMINGKTLTRQQTVDVLRAAKIDPDGHNIVLQGDVIRFMDMKSNDRREIIEDIAGISVFEEKKNKAMNELNKVQERLNEAEIILTEREKTLKDLKKDRDQALEYKNLEKNVERNKATKINLILKDKKESLDGVEKKFVEHEENIKKIQESIDSLRKDIQEKKNEISAINEELNEKGDKKQRELASEIEKLKTEIIQDSSRKDVVDNELRKLKERKKSLESSLKEHGKKVKDLQNNKERIRKENLSLKGNEEKLKSKIDNYKQKHGIIEKDDISMSIEALDQQIEDMQRKTLESEEDKQQLVRKIDRLEYELETIEKDIDKINTLKKEDADKINKLRSNRNEFKEITKLLSNSLNESAVFSTQLSSARTKLMDSNESLARLKTQSIRIREMSAGDVAVKKILSMNIPGVFGTVGELGQVSKDYALALEVAAGPRMRSLVVSNDQVAAKCINILKESRSGVVTFLPLNKLKERKISEEEKRMAKSNGAHGLAIDLVKYDAKFRNVFKYVFSGTVVVSDLAVARQLGVGRGRMISMAGDLVEVSGAMVGGYRRKSGGLGFQQKEVNQDMSGLEKDIARLQNTVSMLEGKKTENEEIIVRVRERKAVLEAEIKAAEVKIGSGGDIKELNSIKKELKIEIKELSVGLKDLEKENKIKGSELIKLKGQRQKEMSKLSKLNSSEINKSLESFEEAKQKLKEQWIKNDSEFNSIDKEIALYDNENNKTIQILRDGEKEFDEFSLELKGLIEDLTGNKDILKIKEVNQRKFYAVYNSLFNKRAQCEKFIIKKDTDVIRSEERVRSVEGKRNEYSIKKAILSGEVEGLEKEFEQYKEVQLRRGMNLGDLEIEIRDFENMLRKLGNVNLRSLEIYDKVYEEYKGLIEKFDKLKLEKEDVLKLMFEIESRKQETFMKTFNLLERNFKEIFASLSTKGDAELVIENPENLFEGGIDIRVRLASNKYIDVKGLSGGEKTLVAVAFLFAVQEFEPSWFYLLDEIDAALDKKNSELLSKLIAKYSTGAQYIVITHNDAIISESETLYGVTMQDGVSKVMSMRVK
ncbi:chromosome segregation protein SMC [archaeon]|jgi:chromosome segregation protein|nr:chromosome segregation protein SMC [archaeon]MBT4670001.1 chromosome segregation protein SMC [archaeon]MBT5287797.1 chromosome segregation protein SMC [archaeon]MBT7052363.1 chromosome segregation protein SMC [archaeon]MBT7281648.1 chromosome segregation protein SMC [archaeon]